MFNFLFSLLLEVHFFNTPGGTVCTVHHLLVLITVLTVLARPTQRAHMVHSVRPGCGGYLTWEVPPLIEHNTLFVMIDLIPITGCMDVVGQKSSTQSIATWNDELSFIFGNGLCYCITSSSLVNIWYCIKFVSGMQAHGVGSIDPPHQGHAAYSTWGGVCFISQGCSCNRRKYLAHSTSASFWVRIYKGCCKDSKYKPSNTMDHPSQWCSSWRKKQQSIKNLLSFSSNPSSWLVIHNYPTIFFINWK